MKISTPDCGNFIRFSCALAFLLAFSFPCSLSAQCTQPAPNALCTPPTTWDKDVVATGNVDFQTLTTYTPSSIDKKVRITGTGTVTVNNSDLKILNSSSVVYIDGPTLIINNGNLILESGARFLMTNGKLRVAANFQQTTNSVICITGSDVMIGEEVAGGVNFTANTSTSANWQNDGGYRYLKNDCINVTQDFQLQSSGSGTGTNGVDVIIECCIEIADEGANHATPTAFGSADGDDGGNWQCSNKQSIYSSDIVVANGSFQHSINTMTLCDTDIKVNKSGSFQINSGTLAGQNVCVAVQDIFENSGTWTASIEHWFSQSQNSTNVPGAGSETAQATILTNCFGACSCTAAVCTISALTATPGACSNSLYALSGSVTFTTAPSTGTLTVTVTGGGSQTFNAPFTSPQAYSIASQTADGASHTVTATFSATPTCTLSQTYTAPAACPVIDLSLVKSVSNATPNVGGTVTFTILISNAGPSAATGVSVSDPVPSGYSSITNISGGGTLSGSTITWSGISLASGANTTRTFDATVNASGTYLNVAQVSAHNETDIDSSPNNENGTPYEDDEDDATVTPAAPTQIDLELVKSVDNPTPVVGSTVTFSILVTNQGPANATGVSITDPVPSGYSNIANISGGGTASGSTITWSGISLNAGANVLLTFQATVNASGTYQNVAQVAAHTQTDIDSSPNNENGTPYEDDEDDATVTPVAAPTPLIGTAKIASIPSANGDGTYNVTYRILVRNHGAITIHDVALTDNLTTEFGTLESSAAAVNALGEYALTSAPSVVETTGSATVATLNAAFNGSGDQNIFTAHLGENLPVGAAVTVAFTIKFFPSSGKSDYLNQATAKGDGSENGVTNEETTDQSDAGGCFATSGAGASNIPTPAPDPDCDGNPDEAGENDPTIVSVAPPAAVCPANAGTITY